MERERVHFKSVVKLYVVSCSVNFPAPFQSFLSFFPVFPPNLSTDLPSPKPVLTSNNQIFFEPPPLKTNTFPTN
jgi:hypothetical protein